MWGRRRRHQIAFIEKQVCHVSQRCVLHWVAKPLLLVALGGYRAMDEVQPVSRQHHIILVLLLALATAAWAVLVWQGHDVSMDMTLASPTMLNPRLRMALWGSMGWPSSQRGQSSVQKLH